MGRRIAQPTLADIRKWPQGVLVRRQMGGLHASKWPKLRGKSTNPEQIDRVEAFKLAVDFIRRPEAGQLEIATGLTKIAPALARDILLAAVYGQFMSWTTIEGVLWTGVPTPSSPIQRLLDGISQTPGGIMARSPQGWAPIATGDPGDVLAYIGPPNYFEWVPIATLAGFVAKGTWDGSQAYAMFDVAKYGDAAYCCYVPVDAVAGGALAFDAGSAGGMTLSTVNTPNDTATSQAVSNAYAVVPGVGQTSGKWYFECEITGIADLGTQFGAAYGVSGGISQQAAYGEANAACGSALSGGGSGGFNGLFNGARNALCLDLDNGKLWYTGDVTATPISWNNSTSNDPGSNVGGINVGTVPGNVFPYFYTQSSAGQAITLYSLPADLLIPGIPTGFSPWLAGALNPTPDTDTDHWF